MPDAGNAKPKVRRVTRVVIGADPPGAIPGRIVVTDPVERRRLNPPPSPEAMERMDRLERSSAWSMSRMKDILLD